MYLSALHVRCVPSGDEGINAFKYVHGRDWLEPPAGVPDDDPGRLVKYQFEVPPGGNRVRSFLDVIAPDSSEWEDVRAAIQGGLALSKPPMNFTYAACRIRFSLDEGLRPRWLEEFRQLLDRLHALWTSP
jgi:hypothetical protein